MREVFLTFLRLGCTSFGGPIAHLGYFRQEFVVRKQWLDEAAYGQMLALCSILPGPTSSQVGMLIGLKRASVGGAFAAWAGFTTPSAIILALFAAALGVLERRSMAFSPLRGAMDGLLLAAVGVVAVAVLGLARSLCTDRRTKSIAIGALIMAAILARSPWGWTPIALGAIAGIVFLRDTPGLPATDLRVPFGRRSAAAALVIFVLLIIGVVTAGDRNRDLFLVATCLRAGSLVFGGGHVVLPLLARLVNARLVTGYDFFAGYGAAQAVPGPLFTFASFLGEKNSSALHGGIGALVATVAIFVPSFLLLAGIIPFWEAIRRLNGAGAALRGANAAVVGVLGAILYNPMLGLVYTPSRLAIALGAFLLIGVWNIAPWIVVVLCALAGAIFPYVAS